jgi:predicted kinase
MVKLKELLESSKSDNSPGPKGYAPFVTPEKFQQYKAYLTRIFETSGMKLIKEGVEDKGILKAIFLAGGPGSGKTWVTRGLYGIPKKMTFSAGGLKLVNQDTELEMLLKKYFGTTDLDNMPEELFIDITGVDFQEKSYDNTSGMRAFAKSLTKARMENYVRGRLGVIVDGTGHKYQSIAKKKQRMEDLGYDCYMVFVNTPLEIALKRNLERDRVVPEKIVRDSWHDVQQNLGGFQKLFGRNFLIVDNAKTLDEDEAIKNFNQLVKQGVNKFIKAPVKNSIGKKWIRRARLLKKQGIK